MTKQLSLSLAKRRPTGNVESVISESDSFLDYLDDVSQMQRLPTIDQAKPQVEYDLTDVMEEVMEIPSQDFSRRKGLARPRKQLGKGVSQLTLCQAGCQGVLDSNVVWRNNELLSALLRKERQAEELAEFKSDCHKNYAAADRANAVSWRKRNAELIQRRRAEFMEAMNEEVWNMEQDMDGDGRSSLVNDLKSKMDDVVDEEDEIFLDDEPGDDAESAHGDAVQLDQNKRASHRMSDFGAMLAVQRQQPRSSGGVSSHRDSILNASTGMSGGLAKVARTSLAAGKARSTLLDGVKRQSLAVPNSSQELGSPSESDKIQGNKSSRRSRMEKLVALEGKHRQQEKMMALMAARKAEFECLPVAERKALREAFVGCDTDKSGTLSTKELRKSLVELGVVGRNPEEKKAITTICKEAVCLEGINFFDFCFDIVPRARDALQVLRQDQWLARFNAYDADGSGYLDMEECQAIVRELCAGSLDSEGLKQFTREFPALFEQCRSPGGDVDFQGFVMLIAMMEEKHARIRSEREKRIAQYWCLPAQTLLRHRGELVPLYEAFEKADKDGSGYLEKPEVIQVLLERGLSPQNGEHGARVEETLSLVEKGSSIGFREFLHLVTGVRDEAGGINTDDIRVLFKKYDRDGDGQLSFAEASLMICESSLAPECPDDQNLLQAMMEEADEDGSGDLDEMELAMLLQRMLEKIRAHQRKKEMEIGIKLGYKEMQINELRDVFLTLDVDNKGKIYPDSLLKVMELTGREGHSTDDICVMLTTIDRTTPQTGACDFTRFLKFMTMLRDK